MAADMGFPGTLSPTIGQAWPQAVADGGTTGLGGGFNTIDCKNGTVAPTYSGNRFSWVADPAGSGLVVAKVNVNVGDSADIFGGHRAEMWRYPRDVNDGDDLYRAWALYFPPGFSVTGWGATMGQVHPGDGLSPVCGFYVIAGNMIFAVRDIANFNLGALITGQWLYLVSRVFHQPSSSGFVRFWWAAGSPPNIANTPTVSTSAVTQIGGNSWDKLGLYSDPSTGFNQSVYLGGFGRSSNSSIAIANARFSGLSGAGGPPIHNTFHFGTAIPLSLGISATLRDITTVPSSVPILDLFTAADGSISGRIPQPSGSGSWVTPEHTGDQGMSIASNVVASTAGTSASSNAVLTGVLIGPNCDVQFKLAALPPNTRSAFINFRVPNITYPRAFGTGSTYYELRAQKNSGVGDDRLILRQIINGTNTDLTVSSGSDTGFDWAVGDIARVTAQEVGSSTLLVGYRNGIEICRWTDSTVGRPTGAGLIAIGSNDGLTGATTRIDDVRASQFTAKMTASIPLSLNVAATMFKPTHPLRAMAASIPLAFGVGATMTSRNPSAGGTENPPQYPGLRNLRRFWQRRLY